MPASQREHRLQQLYSDTWIKRLKAFVARRYHDFGDWEGWFEEAHQNLALKIDSMPVEQEISDALVYAVFKNELISVKRKRLGYPRPRAWLREFAELGQDLFEWLCLHRLPREQVIANAEEKTQKQAYSKPGGQTESSTSTIHRDLLIQLTDTMIDKRECDGVRPHASADDEKMLYQIAAETPSVEDSTEHTQLALLLSVILGVDKVTDTIQDQAAQRLTNIRNSLDKEPLLSDMEILILRCYYFQGMSQNDIAKLVKLPLQQVVRKREAAIKRIRSLMEVNGLTKEAFEL